MAQGKDTPEFKAKLVLEVLQGEQELGQIAAANKINSNLLRNRKKEFVTNASRAFDETRQEKQTR